MVVSRTSIAYCLATILVGLVSWSRQVTVHTEYAFCYPGTKCWDLTLRRTYRAWTGICLAGGYQSPIDLPIVHDHSAGVAIKLDMKSYKHKHFNIQNNGHTIIITPLNTNTSSSHGGGHTTAKETDPYPYPGFARHNYSYIFAQTHFHWGPTNDVGSEHTINGSSFSLEMHLVHYKSKFDNLKEAALSNEQSALAVIALFFQASDDNPDSPHFKEINKHFPLEYQDAPSDIIKLNLLDFLPKRGSTYYRYQGSLTTPDCEEIVQWSVFDDAFPISTRDLLKFRNASDIHGHPLGQNHREIQHGNLRQIYYLKLL